MSKDITVRIQSVGASSYTASVSSPTNLLTETVTSTTVTCRLWLGTAEQTTFLTRWFKDNEEINTGTTDRKSIVVTRDDVTGSQVFICKCYTASDTERKNPVAQHGINIYDEADEFRVDVYITSTNKEVSVGNPVTVSARILRSGDLFTPPSNSMVDWRMDVCRETDFHVLASVDTNSDRKSVV